MRHARYAQNNAHLLVFLRIICLLGFKKVAGQQQRSFPISLCVCVSRPVSGYVNRGELVAVMGPSAAGKSTLFNALTYQNLSGLKVRLSNNNNNNNNNR